jgi:hypothetical protein
MTHELKCWPEYFGAVVAGAKRFEIRENDRGFDVGHIVTLREWEPGTERYTGRSATYRIGYMTSWGQKPGTVVFSLEERSEAGAQPSEGMFPIMGLSIASRAQPIPWSMIAPHEAQAMANHGQSLEKLASRGGLDPIEAVAVLSGQRCPNKVADYPTAYAAADKRLRAIVAGRQPSPSPGPASQETP